MASNVCERPLVEVKPATALPRIVAGSIIMLTPALSAASHSSVQHSPGGEQAACAASRQAAQQDESSSHSSSPPTTPSPQAVPASVTHSPATQCPSAPIVPPPTPGAEQRVPSGSSAGSSGCDQHGRAPGGRGAAGPACVSSNAAH